MAFPRGLARVCASSVTSCYPLALLPHLGYLPKFLALTLVVAGSCSGRKVRNSSNVIALPMLFRGRGGDFTRTFLDGSGGFDLFRAVWVCGGGSELWPARALAGLLGAVSCPLSSLVLGWLLGSLLLAFVACARGGGSPCIIPLAVLRGLVTTRTVTAGSSLVVGRRVA